MNRHRKPMQCRSKKLYRTVVGAWLDARKYWRCNKLALHSYKCSFCDGYHLASQKPRGAK